jgi:hypothetical protein
MALKKQYTLALTLVIALVIAFAFPGGIAAQTASAKTQLTR